jgi:xanthine dehydrogenase small subunit
MSAIVFVLDGETVRADAVDPNTTLLHWLRANRKTGTKEGCAEGECGACAVAWRANGPDGRARWEVVNSCLVLLPSVHGRELVTSEGLASADGALHPAQRCMAEGGGSQCGYCTPGFVVSLFGEMYRGEEGPFDPECIAGNLCRCTGYRPIREASEKLAQLRTRSRGTPDRFRDQLATPVPALPAIEHASASPITGGAPRQFARPSSLHDAVALLGREPHRTLVNGGTDVTVEVNQRHKRHDAYLSLEGVPELSVFEERDDMLVIGAGVSLASIEERLHDHVAGPTALGRALPMLIELLPLFSSRLIRTRATFGGNLGTASPIGDGPPALLAIDAEVVLASHDARADAINRRIVPLSGYFLGYRKTARAPYELIEAIRIPRPFYAIQRFYKVSKRRLDDISSVAGAFALDRDEDGRVTRARLAFGGVAATPIRLPEIEARLLDRHVTPHELEDLAHLASESVTPIDDHRASARYRKAMVASLLRKLAFDLAGATPMSVEVSP